MKDFILLTVLLISGYQITYTQAIAPGEACVTNGALAANPADNTQFFYCNNGIVALGTCINGQIFNPNTAQCSSEGSVTTPDGAVNCLNNNYATFPVPGDNTRFYYCFNNQALLVTCPYNYYYSAVTRTCTQGTTSGGQCPPGVNAFIATGCSTFLVCVNGVGTQQTCPNGYYFQPLSGACGTTPPAGCSGSGGGSGGSSGTCTIEGSVQYNPSNCQSYLLCTNKQLVSKNCPPNYYFSKVSLTCSPSTSAGCPNTISNSEVITYPVYPNYPGNNYPGNNYPAYPDTSVCSNYQNAILADTSNCQRYIYCVNGTPYSLFCQSGYYFNPATGSCGSTIPATCNTQNIDNNAVTCPSSGELTLIDPTNCKNYISCNNGFGMSLSCGPGLFYNPQMNSCSPIAPAGCVAV